MKKNMMLKAIMAGMAVAMGALGALAMPTKAQFQQVMPMVTEMSRDDVAAVKAKTMAPREAADRALSRASDKTLDEASRYLFFEAAFAFYVIAADYDQAAGVVTQLKTDIKNVSDADIIEFIERRLRNVKREHAGQLYGILQDARTREEMVLKVVGYRQAVKKNPKDTISQIHLAYCNVLIGNWTEALKAFAASEGQVAAFSQAEIGRSKSPIEIGNFWWSYTINDYDFRDYSDQLTEAFQAHAKDWYRMALKDTSLTGVRRDFIAKRVGEEKPAEVAEVKKPAKPSEVKETTSVVKTASGAKLPTRSYDLGKGVKMEFVQCPAGTFTMGAEPSYWKDWGDDRKHDNAHLMYPHKVTITRPFWMAKYPLTIGQWCAVQGKTLDKDDPRLAFGFDSVVGYSNGFVKDDTIKRLNDKLKGQLPKGYVVRLPTEAEYDYAFKANSSDANDPYRLVWQRSNVNRNGLREIMYMWNELSSTCEKCGVKFSDSQKYHNSVELLRDNDKGCRVWLFGQVGKKKPNAWGIHDMMMGSRCLDVVPFEKEQGSEQGRFTSGVAYEDAETDPLRMVKGYLGGFSREVSYISYRPSLPWVGSSMKFFAHTEGGMPRFATRLVIGPDLEKEKGFKSAEKKVEKLPTKSYDLGKGVKMEFVQCPAGKFRMGVCDELWDSSFKSKSARSPACPQYPHNVTITRPFWMARYAVTVDVWESIVGKDANRDGTMISDDPDVRKMGPKMIMNVSEEFTQEFLYKLSRRIGGQLPAGYVVRLATEAEYEYAFRANSTDASDVHCRVFLGNFNSSSGFGRKGLDDAVRGYVSMGDDLFKSIKDKGVDVANYSLGKNHTKKTYLIRNNNLMALGGIAGIHAPNAWGLYDMFVASRCLDVKPKDVKLEYGESEVDPLVKQGSRNIVLQMANCGWDRWDYKEISDWHGYTRAIRVVIGPDLEKEKGFKK